MAIPPLAGPRPIWVPAPPPASGAPAPITPPPTGWVRPPPLARRPPIHPKEIRPAEWTGLVYMAADNNLSAFGRRNLLQMEEVGSIPGRFNLLVLADVGPTPGQPQDWPVGTRLYYVERNEQGGQIQSRELYVEPRSALGQRLAAGRGHLDLGDPEVLRATVEYVQRNVPSERFFLNLWNHGNAWRGIAYDDGARNHLDLSGGDLERALGGLPIDLLGADACLTATVEVATLAERLGVKSLVGCPELEPAAGWSYGDLLRRFARAFEQSPSVSAHQLSFQLVRSYAAGENEVLSATHLERWGEAKLAIRTLSDQILEAGGLANNPTLLALYDQARRYGREQIDLGEFVLQIRRHFPEGPLTRAAGQVNMLLRGSTLSLAGRPDYNLASLSIHAPTSETLLGAGLDESYRRGLWQELGWARVLESRRAPPSDQPPPAWALPRPGGPPLPPGAPPTGPDDHRPALTRLSEGGPGPGHERYIWTEAPVIYSAMGPQLWIDAELPSGGWTTHVDFEVLGPRSLRAKLSVFREPGLHADRPHRLSVGVPLPIGSGAEGPFDIEVVGLGPAGPQVLRRLELLGPQY